MFSPQSVEAILKDELYVISSREVSQGHLLIFPRL